VNEPAARAQGFAVAIHDRGFVRAPVEEVYGVVAVPARYEEWWPRVTSRSAGGGGVQLILAGFGKVAATMERDRAPDSFVLVLSNDRTRGALEWFLEPLPHGTLVNVLLRLERAERWNRRRELAYRSAVRDAVVALTRALEAPTTT
jgi:hypothetical protein